MSTSLVIALVDIAKKPGGSMSTSLITTRRICRIFDERVDSIRAERRAMRRKASKLSQYLPFTASAIAEIEQQAADHRSVEWRDLRTVLAAFGRSLVLDTEGLAKGLGFDRLCDLLAINTVERETARKDGISSLADLVFAYALEESSARRGQEWNDARCSTPVSSQPQNSSGSARSTFYPIRSHLVRRSARSCRQTCASLVNDPFGTRHVLRMTKTCRDIEQQHRASAHDQRQRRTRGTHDGTGQQHGERTADTSGSLCRGVQDQGLFQ